MSRRPDCSSLVAILACVLVLGCSTKVRPYECGDLVAVPEVDARQVWECHRDIMTRAAKGKNFTIREFQRASEFFEGLTEIPADSVQTRLGPMPGKKLKKDLRKWDEWFEQHADRLAWDPVEETVVVDRRG